MARYVGRAVIGFTLLVMGVLVLLFGIYLIATEQDEIGVGSYALSDAFWFVLLNLPRHAFEMLRTSELTVMRAAGVSAMRLGFWAGGSGVLLAIATWVIGDYVAPPLERMAREQKTFAKYKQVSLTSNESAWAKDGDTFISVQQQTNDNQFGGVYLFRFDADHRLLSVGHATDARASADKLWELHDYAESVIQAPVANEAGLPAVGESIIASRVPLQTLSTNLSPEFLGLASTEPQSLPGRTLLGVIRHYRANGLDARIFETALWSRIARTTALVFVVMLAVPFALGGSARAGGGGVRTVLGILVGTAFFLLAKTLENGVLVFDLSPVVVAWIPTVLLATVTFIALARVR
jgi:lipopolysaccharide export system permease protein